MALTPKHPDIRIRRVLRTFELGSPPAPPVSSARPLPPEKAARIAARELKRRAVDGDVLQISVDGGETWIDIPPQAAIPVVDDTVAVSGMVWEDPDGTGVARAKAAPDIARERGKR